MLVWISVGLAIVSVTGIWFVRRESLRCGEIEGVLLVDGRPAPEGTLVVCQITEHEDLPCSPMCFSLEIHNRYAETSQDGTFNFKEIRAGEVTLGRSHGTLKKRTYCFGLATIYDEEPDEIDCEQLVVVAARKRVRVVFGDGCRTVRGRLILPAELQTKESEPVSSTVYLRGDADGPNTPEGIDMAARAAWWKEASQTEEGIAWREAVSRRYHVSPDARGNFVVDNMKPGRYAALVLSVAAFDKQKSTCAPEWDTGETEPFCVPVGSDSAGSSAVELGDLPVFMRKRAGMPNAD